MKSVTTLVILVFAALTTLSGCAVVPFAPTIAHVVPRMLFPGHDPATARNSGDPADNSPNDLSTAPNGGTVAADSESKRAQAGNRPAQLADGTIPMRLAHTDITSDSKAHEVGDILMVTVAETINGQSSAQTDLSNKRSVNSALPNMFSAAESLAKHNPMLNLASLLSGTSDNEASGKGDMSANDTLNALVAVSVIGTSPNGKLKIKGARSIRINDENDTLYLSGLVSPSDIDSDNSIPYPRAGSPTSTLALPGPGRFATNRAVDGAPAWWIGYGCSKEDSDGRLDRPERAVACGQRLSSGSRAG